MRQIIELEHEGLSKVVRQFIFLISLYTVSRETGSLMDAEELKYCCCRQARLLRQCLRRYLTDYPLDLTEDEITVWVEGLEVTLQRKSRGRMAISRMALAGV